MDTEAIVYLSGVGLPALPDPNAGQINAGRVEEFQHKDVGVRMLPYLAELQCDRIIIASDQAFPVNIL